MTEIHQIPPDLIDPYALSRDRSATDDQADAELRASISAQGLRHPVEVWHFPEDDAYGKPYCYGLISGYRRLAAARALGWDKVPAILHHPRAAADLYALMVAENEMRSQISPWEKGALIARALGSGLYPNPDAAIDALFTSAGRQKKHRLRSCLMVAEEFADRIRTPERLSVARIERLASAIRAGWADEVHEALPPPIRTTLEVQWRAIEPVLAEALMPPRDEADLSPPDPRAPRRRLTIRKLTLTRELTRSGWIIRFSGPDAKSPGLIDDVFKLVDHWLGES